MSTEDVAQAFVDAWQAGDAAGLVASCAADFTFSGPVPEPLSAEQTAGLVQIMKGGFPDIQYNTRVLSVEGNVAHVLNQLTGTHTGDLDLTPMGMGVIPATGKSFSLPEEPARITVEGDKVVNYNVDAPPDGGLPGILAQIGVEMPG